MRKLLSGLVLLCVVCTSLFAAQKPLPSDQIPHGLGVNIHFRHGGKQLDMIRDAGFKIIRMDLTWGAVERQKGKYRFKEVGYDELTKGCVKRDIRLLYILDYSNRLYESDRSVRTEEGREAYAEFARAAAKRYSGHGILWEIWNEPNIAHFWKPQPSVKDYCKLVKAAAPRIRRADPSGQVVVGATSTMDFKWLEACFKEGLLKWADAVSVHPYRPQHPETVLKDYKKLRQIIKKYAPEGKDIPILSGEWGYSNVNWDNTPLSDTQQARYLVREFLINKAADVPVSIWYDWSNDGTNPEEREHNFGTVEHNLEPKAAYHAASTLNHTLAGYAVDELSVKDEDIYVVRLSSEGKKALAIWTPGKARNFKLDLKSGTGRLVGMLGDSRQISWEDGPEVQVSPSPQYLLPGEK